MSCRFTMKPLHYVLQVYYETSMSCRFTMKPLHYVLQVYYETSTLCLAGLLCNLHSHIGTQELQYVYCGILYTLLLMRETSSTWHKYRFYEAPSIDQSDYRISSRLSAVDCIGWSLATKIILFKNILTATCLHMHGAPVLHNQK